ncbi:MAG TPA: GNAT family N-acetyltransferase [Gemmatimonadaceae bacterium]|jgi:GNAT superfamily N-acetyltransferase|nr:GNAT family N-acetyltransferase [Gemmatimonadaceae bacterium]
MSLHPELTVRPATRGDVDALELLIERSVRALSIGHYSATQIESALRFVFGVDTRLVDHGCYLVVEHQGQIVAAGGWSRWRTLFGGDRFDDRDDDPLDPAREAARIRAFFVHPDWTRRGLARLLFGVCTRAARAAGFHSLELMATLPGEPLYTALGFHADARTAITLPDGVELPLVRMSRSIADVTSG